jgi:hypothetical protein
LSIVSLAPHTAEKFRIKGGCKGERGEFEGEREVRGGERA